MKRVGVIPDIGDDAIKMLFSVGPFIYARPFYRSSNNTVGRTLTTSGVDSIFGELQHKGWGEKMKVFICMK